ncbi:hypothetical protein C818_02393 [Lachnospiraceae bacterium MD308]|jgi:Transcriptional regulator|nr:hypothetical protein C818_02393 [Lachnospiraceae bacterium MD308]MCI8502731.1 TetR/AcrR family transcriptional regulator [Dorea sp.]
MDLRTEKTENAIKNAFIQLRAKKALEKVTIKELCEEARIHKSTFYSHYQDIYDLSRAMETEVVKKITGSIPEYSFNTGSLAQVTRELTYGFMSQSSLINILFSGNERSHLAYRIEESLKEIIFEKYPEYKDDLRWNVVLSYCIQGAYWAFQGSRGQDVNEVIGIISEIAERVCRL